MRQLLGIVGVLTCTALLGGCRTEYLISPQVWKQAHEARIEEQRRSSEEEQRLVAVRAQPIDNEQPGVLPPTYVRLSALRLKSSSGPERWVASARNRKAFLGGGGVLLALGLASITAGVTLIAVDHRSSTMPCGLIHSTGGDSCLPGFVGALFGYPSIAGGLAELIPGAILLGLGAKPVEVAPGASDVVYVPELGTSTSERALPAGTLGLAAKLTF